MRGQWTTWMVAVALGGGLWAGTVGAVDLEPILDRMDGGDASGARGALRDILAERPEHPGARFLKARLLAEGGETSRAIEWLEGIIEDYPEIPEPYNNLAELHVKEGRMEQARDILEAGLATSDAYATLYQNLSTVYVEMARQSYAQALRLEGEEARGPGLATLAQVDVQASQQARATLMTEVVDEPVAEEPPPVEPAATAEPSAAESALSAEQRQAAEALKRWARAWSAQDVDSYLGYYTSEYSPPRLSRSAWRNQRDQRLNAPDWIEVELSGVQVYEMGSNEMVVVVQQDYKASNYSSLTLKSFTMVRGAEGWRIAEENTLRDVVR